MPKLGDPTFRCEARVRYLDTYTAGTLEPHVAYFAISAWMRARRTTTVVLSVQPPTSAITLRNS